jgi:hypothetical protein
MTTATLSNVSDIETTEDMVIVPVRESVAVEIKTLLDNIGASYLKVGSLLNEAHADFEAQKEFLAWAEAEFSIKKAQCYNLMNVARCFEGNGKFKGVAMRVMLALVPYADEAQIMEAAADLAMDGKLNTAAVNTLTGKPAKVFTANPVVTGIEQAKAAQDGAQDPESQLLQTVPDAPNTNTSTGVGVMATLIHAEDSTTAVTVTMGQDAENERTSALLATIKSLNETIADMQFKLNERTSEREVRKSAAPMLPQFKSKCMYARLGLSAEEAGKKAAVNKAKRELIKLGYGEGHEAYPMIAAAVDSLIA